ncbi:hypothetical protein [Solirubrum puertoriconensis]|uniref:Glycerophosphoryl diester phosphodiesterase membrane domain-containing protein n=1 Tax=Solirubrum puertoriconensis TaxID=1751427 RepID=A0A9X0HJ58_SOLP1|nr:hypothetical protein [Solirubrum puertoriconensis]KUG06842.1 hypothetical protein ASU33_05820 [Solirubrum puertoriconensis]
MQTSTATPRTESERTFTTPQDYYRRRDFGQKFEATFSFLGKHGGNLYRVLLVPMAVAMVAIAGLVFSVFTSASTLDDTSSVQLIMVPAYVGLGIVTMLAMLATYAMMYAFVKRRMESPDATAPLTVAEVWAEARPNMLPLVGYGIVATICVVLGYMLLIIPGVYLSMALYLLPCVIVFERADLGETLSRCVGLIRGKWWSTFGLMFVGGIGVGILSAAVGGVLGLVLGFMGFFGSSEFGSTGFVLLQGVQMAINLALYPVLFLLLMFQYFNLVERRDGVSLQWRVQEIGQTPSASTGSSTAPDDTLFRPSYGDPTL